jgi:hypothetical protein
MEKSNLTRHQPGTSKSYQPARRNDAIPHKRTWLPTAKLRRSRMYSAPLDARDMPNRASTDSVVHGTKALRASLLQAGNVGWQIGGE